jgi:hypothetical protein
MPAEAEVVFDAFHHHEWRLRWDSLVRATHVLGGAAHPFVGAVTENLGAGALRGLAMRVWQTRRRFRRLSRFLAQHAQEVRGWQLEQRNAT